MSRERDVYAIECACRTHLELPASLIDILQLPTVCPTCMTVLFIEWKAARDSDGAYETGHAAEHERGAAMNYSRSCCALSANCRQCWPRSRSPRSLSVPANLSASSSSWWQFCIQLGKSSCMQRSLS